METVGERLSAKLLGDGPGPPYSPGAATRTLATQDFRHTTQGETEKVDHFIRRLERAFMTEYGQEGMSLETREALLHGQLYNRDFGAPS